MSFYPKPEYSIYHKQIDIKDFSEYKNKYITRPPYQRKSVWELKEKQSLMDSLFRRYYIPKLVMREVRLSDDRIVREIIDGQQRITAVQEFFDNKYRLPKSLVDINPKLAGKYYKDLDDDIREFADKELEYQVDIIKDIEDPESENHRIIATEIFKRLQEGYSLNYMERVHAQLSSLARNFIVKYADEQTFDYKIYKAVDNNPDKEKFFTLLKFDNTRMRHLQLMARFTMIEYGDGRADLKKDKMEEFINDTKKDGGIGDDSFENEKEAKAVLKNLRTFYSIFESDPMRDDKTGVIKELSTEYFIISIYVLIRHLTKYYVIDECTKTTIREFFYDFHTQWKAARKTDEADDFAAFSKRSQQGAQNLEERDTILRHVFFKYLRNNGKEIVVKDTKRAFSELERIQIYRKYNGVCQQCIRDGKPHGEAVVSWSNYHADHVIPHSKGGQTVLENAELLCRTCNQFKGNKSS